MSNKVREISRIAADWQEERRKQERNNFDLRKRGKENENEKERMNPVFHLVWKCEKEIKDYWHLTQNNLQSDMVQNTKPTGHSVCSSTLLVPVILKLFEEKEKYYFK